MTATASPKKKAPKAAKKTAEPAAPQFKEIDPKFMVLEPDQAANVQVLAETLHSINAFEMATSIDERQLFVASLDPEQFALLWAWAREIDWAIAPGTDNGARASVLAVPACFAAKVAHDIKTVEAIRDNEILNIIWDVPAADQADESPPTEQEASIATVEEQAAEKIANDAAKELTAAPPVIEKDGQIVGVQEPAKPAAQRAIKFRAADEMTAVRIGLELRVAQLDSKAKGLRELHRPDEATKLEREVALIKEALLPQVKPQTAMAFNEKETMPGAVARIMQGEIRNRVFGEMMKTSSPKKGETAEDRDARVRAKVDDFEKLIGNIGNIAGAFLIDFLVEASDRGNQYGLRGLTATPDVIARDAIQAVEMRRSAERKNT